MNILGLSFDYHDSAAALLRDGVVVAASQEERFSRIKHDDGFPDQAIRSCLELAGLTMAEIDRVAFYERPLLKFDRIVHGAEQAGPRGRAFLMDTLRAWLRQDQFHPERRIRDRLGIAPDRIRMVDHHQAHAASAFYCSGFDEATVVTLDGVGEYETASVSHGRDGVLRRLSSVRYPDSIGLFYSALTAFLGFEVNEGEYKVMGMAGFGQPRFTEQIGRLIRWSEDGFSLDHAYFDFLAPTDLPYTARLVELLGPPRPPESPFRVGDPGRPAADAVEEASRHYADIAASVQRVTEEVMLAFVAGAVKATGCRRVAMAGGVALNSLANGRLQRELGIELFIQPAAGDSGGALGAALHTHVAEGGPPPPPMAGAYLGQAYGDDQVRQALDAIGLDSFEVFPDSESMCRRVAGLIHDGAVVGWFQGRFEWGPRALGARSILGNPTQAEMQRTINEKIKFREPFRPFAPAVLAERAAEFFDVPPAHSIRQPESYMLSVAEVRPSARPRLPAVTHVDGTARLQLVWAEQSPLFARLIAEFERLSGVPVLLNTSFNRRGEPIVASPADALTTFSWSGLDYLVMNNILVRKEFVG